jgi:hypothetical protein
MLVGYMRVSSDESTRNRGAVQAATANGAS